MVSASRLYTCIHGLPHAECKNSGAVRLMYVVSLATVKMSSFRQRFATLADSPVEHGQSAR